MPLEPTDVRFFESPAALRDWLEARSELEHELWVGYHKKETGRPSLTWAESVDEVLCFGWIDGIRKRLDDDRYTIRFTPRKKGSTWSRVNVARVAALTDEGRMRLPGLAAFEARSDARTGTYAYENEALSFDAETEGRLRADPKAWSWWSAQAPGYRRIVTRWVLSAKKSETRDKRMAELLADCAASRPIKALRYGRERSPAGVDRGSRSQ